MGLVASKMDRHFAEVIERSGGTVFRDLNGDGWADRGPFEQAHKIPKERFDRLVELGLIEAAGDALFGAPSQTWKIKKVDENV
jgi:hypothetical protein